MSYFLLTIVLLIYPAMYYADTGDQNTSITQTAWFWPLIAICLTLLLSIPCASIVVLVLYYKKIYSDQSDESRTSSSSSFSSTPVRRHHRRRLSHFAGSSRSPPPPYISCDRPENIFVTSSLPPPYEPPSTPVPSPMMDTPNQSGTCSQTGRIPDVSLTLTDPSIQTFRV